MKKVIVFGLVLLMGCSLLLAFPSSKKTLAKVEVAPVETLPIEETVAEFPPVAEPAVAEPSEEAKRVAELESDLQTMSEALKSLQKEIDSTKVMTAGKKDEIDTLVGAIANDVETVLLDLEEKDAIIAELADANASQADQLAYLQGRYDKEISSKFYAKIGGAFGFKEKKVQLGLVGDMGVRIGKGLVIGTGVQYMGFTLDNGIKCDLSLDNLTVNMTIGWEW